MEQKITYLEAFNSMRCFLEKYYEETNSDDVGSLLGDIRILECGSTADPAAWENWIKCIKTNLKHKNS